MKNLKSKFAGIFISLFLGAIILSFVLTGFSGFSLTGNNAATVGSSNVSIEEYNRAVNAQLNQFAQARQGKSLTEKEIRAFGIRQRVLDQLIGQKLLLNYANEMGLDAGKKSVKETMKEAYPFFFNNGKFDVTKYRTALSNARLSPAEFEADLINQAKVMNLNKMISANIASNNYAKEMYRLKNEKAKVLAVSFDKESMTSNLNISKKEIQSFIADKKNEAVISSLYKSYQAQNPEEKKKVDSVQADLVEKHLQRTKRKELKEFNENLTKELSSLIAANSVSKINKLVKKYGITFSNKKEMSLINTAVEGIEFDQEKLIPVFKNKDTKSIIVDDTASKVSILRAASFSFKKATKEEIAKEIEFDQYRKSGIMSNEIVNLQKSKTKIVKASLIQ